MESQGHRTDSKVDPSEDFSRWRASTVRLLLSRSDEDVSQHTKELTTSLAARIDSHLCEVTREDSGGAKQTDLQGHLQDVIHIARSLRSQDVDYEFFPSPKRAEGTLKFDASAMDDMHKGEDTEDGIVQFVVFPGLAKLENGSGAISEGRSVLAKAKVFVRS